MPESARAPSSKLFLLEVFSVPFFGVFFLVKGAKTNGCVVPTVFNDSPSEGKRAHSTDSKLLMNSFSSFLNSSVHEEAIVYVAKSTSYKKKKKKKARPSINRHLSKSVNEVWLGRAD